ncbi:MAG: aminomethyl transferase family protein, partial [Chloroflexi bacterium]
GPDARSILEKLTPADITNAGLPFMTAKELAIGTVPCLALRVTYVGELGWELYCPSEFGLRLWDTLREAGHDRGLVPGGYKAVDSLRLEKGYRVWGADIGPEVDPYAAGLGFCVKLDKGDFLGREALVEKRDAPATTRLACLVLDEPRSVVLGSEPVRVDGAIVGRVTSGGYGYTVGQSIAYAHIPATCAVGTPIEVDIFGTWVGGRVSQEPLYDPRGARVRS